MKLKNEIMEQLKKQKVATVSLQDRYMREPSISLIVLESLNENHNLISLVSSSNTKNKLCEQYVTPLYMTDKNFNIEFLMDSWRTKSTHVQILDAPEEEILDFSRTCNSLNMAINAKIQEKILAELSTLDEQILKTVDLEKYEESAQRLFLDKKQPKFDLHNVVQMDQNILIDFN